MQQMQPLPYAMPQVPVPPAPQEPFKAPELAAVIGGLEPVEAHIFDRVAFFARAENMTLREVYRVLGLVFDHKIG